MRSKWMNVALRAIVASAAVLVIEACGPAFAGIGLEVSYVQVAPPPPRMEMITPVPGPEFMWVEGYWGWQVNQYYWVPGHWERPPRHYSAGSTVAGGITTAAGIGCRLLALI